MKTKILVFALFFTGLLVIGSSTPAWAAQIDARINPNQDTSAFNIKYQKTVFIEYENGGQLADLLREQEWTVEKIASDSELTDFKQKLNEKLFSVGSHTQIQELDLTYTAHLKGRGLQASIDYKVILDGKLSGYTIRAAQGQSPALVDLEWRDLTLEGPVFVDGVEVNLPISPIQEKSPQVAALLSNSEASELLTKSLVDATGIAIQPMSNWHFLFDPTGINVDAAQFGISGDIAGFVVSVYTMGESSLREGRQVERIFESEFALDTNYAVRTVQSSDSGTISVIGFGALDTLDGAEIVGVTPRPPEGFSAGGTQDFSVSIIYGMAGMAAVGGGIFFFISNRHLKSQEHQTGQSGIDPSHLTAYQTSASSGGYQTIRGEAQLKSDVEYQQHRSVYDETEPQQQQQSAPPAVTSGEATCGCATSAEMGSECDCEMQGSCLCDATCDCNASICREHAGSMQ